jgi:hypothetical protein
MNRPAKVRMVYQELRAVLGNELSAKEALETAALLVELFDKDKAEFGAGILEQRPTFDELPVDVGLADGGWRVLSREKFISHAEFGGDEIDLRKQIAFKNYGLGVAA